MHTPSERSEKHDRVLIYPALYSLVTGCSAQAGRDAVDRTVSTSDSQRSYVVAIMAEIQSVCTWKPFTLTNSTSRGLSSSPSYANSAYGFSLQSSDADHTESFISSNSGTWMPAGAHTCKAKCVMKPSVQSQAKFTSVLPAFRNACRQLLALEEPR